MKISKKDIDFDLIWMSLSLHKVKIIIFSLVSISLIVFLINFLDKEYKQNVFKFDYTTLDENITYRKLANFWVEIQSGKKLQAIALNTGQKDPNNFFTINNSKTLKALIKEYTVNYVSDTFKKNVDNLDYKFVLANDRDFSKTLKIKTNNMDFTNYKNLIISDYNKGLNQYIDKRFDFIFNIMNYEFASKVEELKKANIYLKEKTDLLRNFILEQQELQNYDFRENFFQKYPKALDFQDIIVSYFDKIKKLNEEKLILESGINDFEINTEKYEKIKKIGKDLENINLIINLTDLEKIKPQKDEKIKRINKKIISYEAEIGNILNESGEYKFNETRILNEPMMVQDKNLSLNLLLKKYNNNIDLISFIKNKVLQRQIGEEYDLLLTDIKENNLIQVHYSYDEITTINPFFKTLYAYVIYFFSLLFLYTIIYAYIGFYKSS